VRIYSMTATFGKLEHETLTLQPGLNILHAPNEWGKSTWCAFLTAMLYGIDTSSRSKKDFIADKERYAPWSGSPMSGRMDLNWNGRDITIERSTKGRNIFGDFRAYETATGLSVPELTAANCGQQLLGVEKSVFQRAGFLQLRDLPVTQDESLRRRLNALVTTGDESGAGDSLALKLKELKNKCRFNRTGLLPQLEAQELELQDKLNQLQNLRSQILRIRQRQAEQEELIARLENHRDALRYEASRDYLHRLAAARHALQETEAALLALEQRCQSMPDMSQVLQQLSRLDALKQQQDSLILEAQMLPLIPQEPQPPIPFHDRTPQQAVTAAREDTEYYTTLVQRQERPRWLLLLLGILLAVGGIAAAALLSPLPLQIACGVCALLGIVCAAVYLRADRQLKARIAAIREQYFPLPPGSWVAEAERWQSAQAAYTRDMANYHAQRDSLQTRKQALDAQIAEAAPGGLSAAAQKCADIRALWEQLADARREHRQKAELVQTMEASRPEVQPPKFPDVLTWSEAQTARLLSDCAVQQRQLQLQLGQSQGQMEQLGEEAPLRRQLTELQKRIGALQDIYAAVTVAQQTLTDATNALQRRFAPRISRRAQELFSRLTGSRYDRLTLGEDLSLQAGASGENTLRSALWRSEGTADQLYLALRLAVAEELTPEAPMILDDALVRFDDERLTAALRILKEEAESRQVILFTCQKRETAAQENL